MKHSFDHFDFESCDCSSINLILYENTSIRFFSFLLRTDSADRQQIRKVAEMSEKWEIHGKCQSPPCNSAPTQLHRRCLVTGSARANYRHFGLSGHILREMVLTCFFPGATRSSW